MSVIEIHTQTGKRTTRDYTHDERAYNESAKAVHESCMTYKEKRAAEYPPIGYQLDAILKGFNQLRLQGTDLPAELDLIVNQWLSVKERHPKPEGKNV